MLNHAPTQCTQPVQQILQAVARALESVPTDADHARVLDSVAQELPEFFSHPLQIAEDVFEIGKE